MTSERQLLEGIVPIFNEIFPRPNGAISAGFAPSCVHLIGGHSGSGGQSVSMALECGTLVMGSMAPQGSPHSTLVSTDQTGRKEATFSASGAISGGKEAEIAAAVLSQYIEAAQIPDGFNFHAVVSSDIPTTSGLPRLASFALSIMTFLEQLMNKRIAPLEKSKLCSDAVRCNLLDALACEMSKANRLLSIDAISSTCTLLPAPKQSKFVLIAPTPSAAASQGSNTAWDEEDDSDVTDTLADKARCQAAIEHGESALGSLIKESTEARGGSIPGHASALSAIPGVGGFAVPPGAGAEGAVIALVSSEHASNEAFSSPPFGICIPCPPGGGSRRVDVAYHYPEQHAFECILQAKLLKEEGNRLLGEGAIKAALDKYHRMWFFVGSLVKSQGGAGGGGALGMVPNKDEKALTDGERDEAMSLVRGMHMNKSLCYTKIEAWDKGLQAVNKALEFGGDEGKCLYRRGLCSLKLGDIDRARSDLEKALSLAPGDANVAKQLKEVEKQEKKAEGKAKATFKKMFE